MSSLAYFDFGVFRQLLFSGYFLGPAWTTLWVTTLAMAISICIGTAGGLARVSGNRPIRLVVGAYMWVFRGTPLIVQIVFWFDATAELTNNVLNIPALVAGVLALGVNEGAYMIEIVRAGLMSVNVGQEEAARALGMTYWQTMRSVTIPQALRIIIPPTGNSYISLLKTSSLLFTIAIPELFATGSEFYSENFRYFESLSVVAIWYLAMTTVLTELQRRLERRVGKGRINVGRTRGGTVRRLMNIDVDSLRR